MQLSIKLISSPHYIIQTMSSDKNQAIELVKKAIDTIKSKLSEYGGIMRVKSEVFFIIYFSQKQLMKKMMKD